MLLTMHQPQLFIENHFFCETILYMKLEDTGRERERGRVRGREGKGDGGERGNGGSQRDIEFLANETSSKNNSMSHRQSY